MFKCFSCTTVTLEKGGQRFFFSGMGLTWFLCGCVAGGYGVLDNRRQGFRQLAVLLLSVYEKFAVISWLIVS